MTAEDTAPQFAMAAEHLRPSGCVQVDFAANGISLCIEATVRRLAPMARFG